MRTHYFQHVPFEGLGSIEEWLKAAGHEITSTRFYESARLPLIDDIDMLIVMGGPMSVKDRDEFPWLEEEERFIREMIESGKPTLGICLGAQLMASAMGGDIFPNDRKEIGWFPIMSTNLEDSTVFRFPDKLEVFHWHGETFTLPLNSVHIAKSDACTNQAFQIGPKSIGLQFHLETTKESASRMVQNCRNELIDGPFIQSEADILSARQKQYDQVNSLMGRILDYLVSG